MPKRILRHIRREPLPPLAVFLFAVVLSVLLCLLRQEQLKEREDYERSYASVPVYFTVVDPDGTTPDEKITGWAADLFYQDSKLKPSFSGLVKDLDLKMQYPAAVSSGASIDVIGVTSERLIPELSEDRGGSITWNQGYDKGLWTSDEYVCLVPEGFTEEGSLFLSFEYKDPVSRKKWNCTEEFIVAGYTTSRMDEQIYMPYQALGKILSRIRAPYNLTGIGATLNDNSRLQELQEIADQWFARPSTTGKQTYWGHYGYEYFPYALDIDDDLLQSLDETMERSMRVNRLAALAIFCVAAGVGFLAGFLVIRSRKRDIILMRTLGQSHRGIFLELTLEQTLCAAVGVLLGGSFGLWQPLGQLALFLSVFCAGLCAAALIFLGRDLLTTIKEDE